MSLNQMKLSLSETVRIVGAAEENFWFSGNFGDFPCYLNESSHLQSLDLNSNSRNICFILCCCLISQEYKDMKSMQLL